MTHMNRCERGTVYVCICVHNRISYTLKCLASIKKQTFSRVKIVICDDGSTDGTYEQIRRRHPDAVIIRGSGNLWWAGATNACVKHVLTYAGDDDFVFTLNNDTELFPDTIQRLLQATEGQDHTIVGTLNLFYDDHNRIEPSSFKRRKTILFKKRHAPLHKWQEALAGRSGAVEVDTLSGKGVLIPVAVFKTIGLYDAGNLPHYHADTEFVMRAKNAGFRVLLSYDARLLSHQEQSGIGTITSPPDFSAFLRSFRTARSPNHFVSLKNYCKKLYGPYYVPYLVLNLLRIVSGFFLRYLKHHLNGR